MGFLGSWFGFLFCLLVCLVGFFFVLVAGFLCLVLFGILGFWREGLVCWFGFSARLALWFGIVGLEIKLKNSLRMLWLRNVTC